MSNKLFSNAWSCWWYHIPIIEPPIHVSEYFKFYVLVVACYLRVIAICFCDHWWGFKISLNGIIKEAGRLNLGYIGCYIICLIQNTLLSSLSKSGRRIHSKIYYTNYLIDSKMILMRLLWLRQYLNVSWQDLTNALLHIPLLKHIDLISCEFVHNALYQIKIDMSFTLLLDTWLILVGSLLLHRLPKAYI